MNFAIMHINEQMVPLRNEISSKNVLVDQRNGNKRVKVDGGAASSELTLPPLSCAPPRSPPLPPSLSFVIPHSPLSPPPKVS